MVDVLQPYRHEINNGLNNLALQKSPDGLYEPMRYFLKIGGKRMRPILTLLGAELFSGEYIQAKNAALAVEIFHNFSLVHDDIMDNAPLRRGQKTVHEKWNLNTGILSGDGLLIEAYKQLEAYDSDVLKQLLQLFNKTAIEVCEGQQLDMDFESTTEVTIDEYLEMIRLKTAVLLGTSLKMGAIVGGASIKDQQKIYEFGVNLGISFQLQDDYLDLYGDENKVGKQKGGDIIANKKTYLLLTAFEDCTETQKKELMAALSSSNNEEKVIRTQALFHALNIQEKTNEAVSKFHRIALNNLSEISTESPVKNLLKSLAESLLVREY